MTAQEDRITLTPDLTTFAVTVTEATRALIEQVAVWRLERQALTDASLIAASTAMTPAELLPTPTVGAGGCGL